MSTSLTIAACATTTLSTGRHSSGRPARRFWSGTTVIPRSAVSCPWPIRGVQLNFSLKTVTLKDVAYDVQQNVDCNPDCLSHLSGSANTFRNSIVCKIWIWFQMLLSPANCFLLCVQSVSSGGLVYTLQSSFFVFKLSTASCKNQRQPWNKDRVLCLYPHHLSPTLPPLSPPRSLSLAS